MYPQRMPAREAIQRPRLFQAYPVIPISMPRLGPFRIQDAINVAMRQSKTFHWPFMEVTTKAEGGCTLQYAPRHNKWYMRLRSQHELDTLDNLMGWLIHNDVFLAVSGVWYAVAFPREDELPTMSDEVR